MCALNKDISFNVENKTITAGELSITEPVEWHIYDTKGRLLLKKGMQLRSKRQIAKIISLKAFYRVGEKDDEVDEQVVSSALSPFDQIEKVLSYLDRLFKIAIYKPPNPERKLPEKFHELSKGIIQLCEYDLDATIGTIHFGSKYDYTVIHPLHCAILSYCLAIKLGITDERLNTIICAALTANIGMFELQNKLMKQAGPLRSDQRAEVDKHTMRGVVLLKHIGVMDSLWLEIVMQHHEKRDGTGYPRKLKGSDFIQEARILAIADRYHAMVAPRDYRVGMSPTEALKMIFQERGNEVDEVLGSILIKEVGIYPPGAIVELANKEIAIVTRRGEDRMRPTVKSIYTAENKPYSEPVEHECTDEKFKILGLCAAPKNYKHDLYKLWDYDLK